MSTAPAEALGDERQPRGGWLDAGICLCLAAGYLVWLLGTSRDLGYARDEGFYFQAAQSYARWFELLFSEPSRALSQELIDRYWRHNNEHPALMKTLFALSHELLGARLIDGGTAYRLPGMLLSAATLCVTYSWGRCLLGRLSGAVAALSLAFMPRVFYHSHLACFDMPIVGLWLMTAYAYWRSLERPSLGRILAAALLFGLALNTKHNSWLLPPALVLHQILHQGRRLVYRNASWQRAGGWKAALSWRLRVPPALWAMATLSPLLMYATWPWIWHDTLARLTAYVTFHTRHAYYNMAFLGTTYFEPPFPRGYAWLMTLGTVPMVTLVLASVGAAIALLDYVRARRAGGDAARAGSGYPLLWALGVLCGYGPWLSTGTPIFGGTKHWMVAYPFLALFAGRGFQALAAQLGGWLRGSYPERAWLPRVAAGAAAFTCLVGPWTMTRDSHPWGLSAYTPLVGGAPGAATLGLNRTFWGYTTGAVQEHINRIAGPRERVFVHDTAGASFAQMQRDGRLRKDLRAWGKVAGSGVALYHHEQHMSRVEHMIWVDYGTTSPVHVGAHDGVPVVWLYERPGGTRVARAAP